MRKTKVICTLGPAVDSEETLRELILAGMNCARFNFSHGTHESHLATLVRLRRVRDELGAPVATMLDTKGPEIRIKSFAGGPVTLVKDQDFTLTTEDVPGDEHQVSVTYENLHNELAPGCRVLVDDGLVELQVQKIEGRRILCTVDNGGVISN
ncbi:pyruvate kinase, partial [uncultured Oscillibacter sp.]|uniref:pyruvate kinase n=1 Tax=uncultured Oscillibacter sp. TaxID=876091 RepID=UPI0025E84792